MSNNGVYYKLYCTNGNKAYCNNVMKYNGIHNYGSFQSDQNFRTQSKDARALDMPPVRTRENGESRLYYEVLSLQKKDANNVIRKTDTFYMYKVGKLINKKEGTFKLDNDEIVYTNGGEFYELNDNGTIKENSELKIPYLGGPMSPRERPEKEAEEELKKQLQEEKCKGRFCNNLTKKVQGWFGLNPKFKSKKSKTKSKKSKSMKSKTKSKKSKTKKSKTKKSKTKSKKSKTKSK